MQIRQKGREEEHKKNTTKEIKNKKSLNNLQITGSEEKLKLT